MTIAPPEPQTSGTRVALDGDLRFVDNPDTGVREVEARICSYGVGPDTYNTTWAPGWAADGLRESLASGVPVTAVFGHDERTIGNVIGSVAGYEDRPDGLHVKVRMANFDEVPSARVAYSLMRDGHIRGWSFKFREGQTVSDPNHRGALMFTKARLVHVSPVIDPSVPGTKTTAVRSADDPELKAAIDAGVRKALADLLGDERQVTLTIGDDGSITTSGAQPDDGAQDDEPSVPELASAIDGAVDAALGIAANLDLSALPPEVGQLVQLLHAADVAADELLEALGLPDPDGDEPDDDTIAAEARAVEAEANGERAVSDEPWDFQESDYSLDQLRRACLVVMNDGKTKGDMHLPVRTPSGALSRNGVHAAAAVLAGGRGGVDLPMPMKAMAAKKLVGMYRDQLKEDPPASLLKLAGEQSRSAQDDDFARALATLDRIGER